MLGYASMDGTSCIDLPPANEFGKLESIFTKDYRPSSRQIRIANEYEEILKTPRDHESSSAAAINFRPNYDNHPIIQRVESDNLESHGLSDLFLDTAAAHSNSGTIPRYNITFQ